MQVYEEFFGALGQIHVGGVKSLCLQDPATQNQLELFEAQLECAIPVDLVKFWSLHNGQGGGVEAFNHLHLFSIERSHQFMEEKEGIFDVPSGSSKMSNLIVRKDILWSKKWIPIAGQCGGSKLVVDLDPGSKGTVGQVFGIDIYNLVEGIYSHSLSDFFTRMLAQLKNGHFQTDFLVIDFQKI